MTNDVTKLLLNEKEKVIEAICKRDELENKVNNLKEIDDEKTKLIIDKASINSEAATIMIVNSIIRDYLNEEILTAYRYQDQKQANEHNAIITSKIQTIKTNTYAYYHGNYKTSDELSNEEVYYLANEYNKKEDNNKLVSIEFQNKNNVEYNLALIDYNLLDKLGIKIKYDEKDQLGTVYASIELTKFRDILNKALNNELDIENNNITGLLKVMAVLNNKQVKEVRSFARRSISNIRIIYLDILKEIIEKYYKEPIVSTYTELEIEKEYFNHDEKLKRVLNEKDYSTLRLLKEVISSLDPAKSNLDNSICFFKHKDGKKVSYLPVEKTLFCNVLKDDFNCQFNADNETIKISILARHLEDLVLIQKENKKTK